MDDNGKTKEHLMQELEDLRRRIAELEKSETERKQAEEKLGETETRYRQLVEHAPVGIYELDLTTGRFISVNEVMCEYTGYTEEDFLVLHPLELITGDSQKLFLDRMAHYAAGEPVPPTVEFQARTKDGREFWMSANAKYFYQAGLPVRATVVAYDITERKKAEEALRESEENYRLLIENINAAVFQTTLPGTFLNVNRAFAEIAGYDSVEDLMSRTASCVYADQTDRERLKEMLIRDGQVRNWDVRTLKKNGIKSWVSLNAVILRDKDGRPEKILGVATDITERKQKEEMIKMLSTVVEQSTEGMAIADLDGHLIFINSAWCGMHGYQSPKELLGKNLAISHNQEQIENEVIPFNKKVIEFGAYSGEVGHITKDGKTFPTLMTTTLLKDEQGKPYAFAGIAKDITERKQAEEALRISEEKYRILLEESTDPIFSFEAGGRYIYVNEAFAKGVGKDAKDIIGKTIWDVFPKEEADKRFAALDHTFKTGEEKTIEVRGPRLDGDQYYLTTITPIKNKEGQVLSIICSSKNITERKQLEESMRRLHEDLSATIKAIPDLLFEVDRQGHILNYNAPKESLLFVDPEEFLGRSLNEILPPDAARSIHLAINDAAEHGRHIGTIYSLPIQGETKWFELSIAAKGDHKDPKARFIVLAREITERKKMEDERLVMSKLKSTGILAGGIAHDFNNLLAVMLGNLEMVKMYDLDEQETNNLLESARKAAMEARGLTHQLITLAKGGDPVKKIFSIASLISDQISFALRGSSLTSEYFIPGDLWMVEADEGQIGQVIRNIVLNAKEEMSKGGRISVTASNVKLSDSTSPPLSSQDYVKVSISDQGGGVPSEILHKIFDPYFSTKQRDSRKGMGLGLTICRSIIEKHGGTISVETQLGQGTTFHFYLPASHETISEKAVAKEVPSGPGRILVMDDEEMMRDMLESILSKMGYEIEKTEKGERAIQAYQGALDQGRPFDAVILDLTVRGGMGGKETIKELLKIDPSVKAMVASGYDQDPVIQNFKDYGFLGAITKPFMIKDLTETLSAIVGNSEE